MAAHIKKRAGRSCWYLIDGDLIRSLGTTKKGIAEQLLKKHNAGKLNLDDPLPTVKEYYDKWILTKIPPLFRPAQERDYRQHFAKHILAKWTDGEKQTREFGRMRLDQITQDDVEVLGFTGSSGNANCALRTLRRALSSLNLRPCSGNSINRGTLMSRFHSSALCSGC